MEDTVVSTLTPEEYVKNAEKAEEKLEIGDGGADHQQPKINETDRQIVIIEAQPLAWKPPPVDDYRLLFLPVFKDGRRYGLPVGWQVEQRPRTSLKYIGKIDQYYYEPGTNRQFRSLKAVWRHLQATGQQHEQQTQPGQEKDEQQTLPGQEKVEQQPPPGQEKDEQQTLPGQEKVEQQPPPGQEKDVQATRQKDEQTPVVTQDGAQAEVAQSSHGQSRSKVKRKRKQASSFQFNFGNPPEEVTWTLVDAETNEWKPSVGENVVPEAVKEKWAETFTSVVGQKNKAPKLNQKSKAPKLNQKNKAPKL